MKHPATPFLFAIPLIALAHPATAATCTTLAFPPGAETTTREDHVPKDIPLCYDFDARPGQTVTLRVDRGDDMNLGLASVAPNGATHGIIDGLVTYTFKSEATLYRVFVASKKPSGDTTQTFALSITRH